MNERAIAGQDFAGPHPSVFGQAQIDVQGDVIDDSRGRNCDRLGHRDDLVGHANCPTGDTGRLGSARRRAPLGAAGVDPESNNCRSSSDSRRSFKNLPQAGSACQGGIVPSATRWRMVDDQAAAS